MIETVCKNCYRKERCWSDSGTCVNTLECSNTILRAENEKLKTDLECEKERRRLLWETLYLPAKAEVERLKKALEKVGHSEFCATDQKDQPCNCWFRNVQAALERKDC